MKKNILLLSILFILNSCEFNNPTIKDFKGKVELFNEFGEKIFVGIEGTTVELNDISTLTKPNGEFEFKNLKPTNYLIRIKREGFVDTIDTLKSTDTRKNFALLQVPTTIISEVFITDAKSDILGKLAFLVNYKVAKLDENLFRRNIKIVINKEELGNDCRNCWSFLLRPDKQTEWNTYRIDFSLENLKSIGINKGDVFFVRMIPYSSIQFKNEQNVITQILASGQESRLIKLVY